MSRIKLAIAAVLVTSLFAVPMAQADSNTVISGGAEMGMLETPGYELPELHLGYFLRLAVTPGIPRYTTKPRGYVWRSGFSGELTVRAGQTDQGNDDRYAGAMVGLRFDAAFSQRRMGLLKVSGRGGFFIAVRAGIVRANSFSDSSNTRPSGPAIDLPTAPAPDTQRTGSVALGTYILLGKTLRLGTEFSMFAMGYSRDVDPRIGAMMRFSLGTTL